MSGLLDGIRVLDLSRLLPGGFATGLLADLGAEVIKVEQPGVGDYMRWMEPKLGDESAASWVVDRGKRSIGVDLKSPRGVEVVRRLARIRRRVRRELPARRRRPARRRLRGAAGREPPPRLLLDLGVRAESARCESRRATT